MTLDPFSTFEELCYKVDGRVRRAHTREMLPDDDTCLCDLIKSREVLEVVEGFLESKNVEAVQLLKVNGETLI